MDSSVSSGLISGGTVVLGVGLGAVVTRLHDRRRRLDAATWHLLGTSRLRAGGSGRLSEREVSDYFESFMANIHRIIEAGRFPIRHAAAIRREAEDIHIRFLVAVGQWELDPADPIDIANPTDPPNLRDVVGERLSVLVFGQRDTEKFGRRLGAALDAAGLREATEQALATSELPSSTPPGAS